MIKIILVRHGETEDNDKGVYSGFNDTSLTQKGLRQAEIVSEKLREENIEYIVSSNLNRTMKTAEIINKNHNIDIILEKKLREMNFGSWEGLSYKEIKDAYPKELKNWENDWMNYSPPNGESSIQMYDRVIKAIDEMMDQYRNKNILIVSHAGCIRAILSHLIGCGIEDYWKFKIDNCGLSIIEIVDDFPILAALNK